MGSLQGADVGPTSQLAAAIADRHAAATKLLASWNAMKGAGLTALNAKLKAANLTEVSLDVKEPAPPRRGRGR